MHFQQTMTKRKAIITLGILGLLAIFFIVAFTRGVQVSQDNSGITVSGGIFYSAKVPYSEIKDVKLVTALDCGTRSNGVSLGSYQLGNYKNSDYGHFKCFVSLDIHEFIVVTYGDDKTLVFNRKDSETTKETYESLLVYMVNN